MAISSSIKRWACLSGLLLLVASLLSGCNANGINNAYTDTATSEPTTHVVDIKDFKYSQVTLILKPGDSITWTNLDIVPHTATAVDKSWTSPELKTGESYTLQVTTATSVDYFCIYHPSMVATLKIVAG
ncbi:MAG: plastocyanin/azurin family copper-binding protein [Granulosicoccaceae bacterium]